MTYIPDSPQALRPEFDKPGRPLSDWQVLEQVWRSDESVREACGDSFGRFVSHAYAELATESMPGGPELTDLIWKAIEGQGFEVRKPKPIHFGRRPKKGFFAKLSGAGRRAAYYQNPGARM